jgi:hypothetical protein
MKDLKDIQIEIKKELGGVSLNHLINYACLAYKKYIDFHFSVFPSFDKTKFENKVKLFFSLSDQNIFKSYFILLNDQKQALNIFDQSEEFQRNLYDVIQFIKIINNK